MPRFGPIRQSLGDKADGTKIPLFNALEQLELQGNSQDRNPTDFLTNSTNSDSGDR